MVCPYNYFRPGGVQTCIRELSDELRRRGHYVRVIAPKPRRVPESVENDVILLGGSAEFNTPFHTKADIGITRDTERLDKLFASEKFDVLHIHEPGLPLFGVQMLARSISKNVGTMHASLPDSMISKSFEKLMTPVARFIEPRLDATVAVSEVAKSISHNYVPSLDIKVIPNGIRLKNFRPARRINAKKKTILFVGRLERRKGVAHLLDAYALLAKSHDDIELKIVGDGRLRSRLEARVAKYDIPNVSFLGFVSEAEKLNYMQQADIFCSPALFGESFGIVLLEAMACGAIVVCGNNPGYESVMTGRGRISLIDPLATADFARRLELLLYDEELRTLWLKWALPYVRQFDYSAIAEQYENIYKQVLK